MSYSRKEILETVCNYYDLNFNLMPSATRKAKIVKARQIYCYLCSVYTIQSLSKIGETINRDHATALYSINEIKAKIKFYSELQKEIDQISFILYEKSESQSSLIPNNVNLLYLTENYTNSFIKTT